MVKGRRSSPWNPHSFSNSHLFWITFIVIAASQIKPNKGRLPRNPFFPPSLAYVGSLRFLGILKNRCSSVELATRDKAASFLLRQARPGRRKIKTKGEFFPKSSKTRVKVSYKQIKAKKDIGSEVPRPSSYSEVKKQSDMIFQIYSPILKCPTAWKHSGIQAATTSSHTSQATAESSVREGDICRVSGLLAITPAI